MLIRYMRVSSDNERQNKVFSCPFAPCQNSNCTSR